MPEAIVRIDDGLHREMFDALDHLPGPITEHDIDIVDFRLFERADDALDEGDER